MELSCVEFGREVWPSDGVFFAFLGSALPEVVILQEGDRGNQRGVG